MMLRSFCRRGLYPCAGPYRGPEETQHHICTRRDAGWYWCFFIPSGEALTTGVNFAGGRAAEERV